MNEIDQSTGGSMWTNSVVTSLWQSEAMSGSGVSGSGDGYGPLDRLSGRRFHRPHGTNDNAAVPAPGCSVVASACSR